jgi:hypothetical protein
MANTKTSDPMELAFLDLEDATRDLIDGDTRLVLAGGPVGIGKSEAATRVVLEYSNSVRRRWELLTDEEKDEDPRRTRYTSDGRDFRPPYVTIPGGDRRLAKLYCYLFWCSYPGEIGVLDDVAAVAYKQSQELLNDACDSNRGGKVSCDVKNLPDPRVPNEFYFHGSLIIIHNWTTEEVNRIFHKRVLSRAATPIHFPDDPVILFDYVYRKAFIEKSLMGYLTAMNSTALGSRRGLGLSTTDAERVLHDVAQHYYANRIRVKEHSFRTMRRWSLQRVKHPDLLINGIVELS